jgi:5-methylcytosine-specific restriction endonuclease McrA
MNDTPLKRCSKCPEGQQWHPATPGFFSRDRTKKDDFHTTCKECEKANKKAFAEAHPEILRERSKQYRESHKEEIVERKKQWQQGESYKEYQKRYHQENIEEIHKQQRRNYQASREDRTAKQRQYLKTEQGRMVDKAHRHKRKAQKRASKGSYTAQQLQEQFQRQRGKCYYCNVKLGKIWHPDHVVPLARGGSNDISNIVIACPACNLSKHARLPHEWPEGGRLL